MVARSGGIIAGQGMAGASSVYSVSEAWAREATRSAIEAACAEAGIVTRDIRAACFGFAGAGREEDRALYAGIVRSLGLAGLAVEPEVASDVEIALDAATMGKDGAILISGTGSVCMGRVGEHIARAGGQGPLLGDEGSGYDIGRKAIIACLRASDGRGGPTILSDVIPASLGLRCIDDAPRLFRDSGERCRISELGFRVLEAAYSEADPVALAIVREATLELTGLAGTVLRRLGGTVPIWLSGGVFAASRDYTGNVSREIGLRHPGTKVAVLEIAPVAGAVWRAFRQIGQEMTCLAGFSQVGVAKLESAPGAQAGHPGEAGEAAQRRLAGPTGQPRPPGQMTISQSGEVRRGLPVTEQRNPRSASLSSMGALDIVRLMAGEDALVAPAVAACSAEIAVTVEWAAASLACRGRLVYVGAGTSGRLGVLDAAECPPTFGLEPGRVVAVIAGGDPAITRSIEGAEDSADDGAAAMDALPVGPDDTVIGIAASGATPFTLGAVRRAAMLGARTVALVSTPGSRLQAEAALTICPVVGPEVLTGSTRLRAATSHKMVLNIISTGCMVLLGKTFGNLMVDVRPLNSKLRDRARRMVAAASGVEMERARQLLEKADGSVKVAIVMALLNVEARQAQVLLEQAGGSIDRVLDRTRGGSR